MIDLRVRAWLKRLLGNRGEHEAARYLRHQRLKILPRNYRTPRGEIDLIARDGDTLVFVEVKTWQRRLETEDPAEAVTLEKQRRLTRAAQSFLTRFRLHDQVRCRFD